MPNKKSAERRMRSSARRQSRNAAAKGRLKTFEKQFLAAVLAGNKDVAARALREVSSVYDKAAKGGVVAKAKANRKKSRLAVRLAAMK
ncbi:MAG: 30S ribosomal protein S20 [Verrucomicrobia bacterium]|nr:30S ribosomal protein S20 [Verrucomicrobiota bacterium]